MNSEAPPTVGTGMQGSGMGFHVLSQVMLQFKAFVANATAKRPEAEGQHDVTVTLWLYGKPFPTQATKALPIGGWSPAP